MIHRPRKVSICLGLTGRSGNLASVPTSTSISWYGSSPSGTWPAAAAWTFRRATLNGSPVSAMRPRMLSFLSRLVTADFFLTALPASGRPGTGTAVTNRNRVSPLGALDLEATCGAGRKAARCGRTQPPSANVTPPGPHIESTTSHWLIHSETRGGSQDLRHDTGQVSTDSVEAGRVRQRTRQQTGHHRARPDPAGADTKTNRTYGTLGRL